jgi:nitrite reductase (cytochrome c-552)
MKKAVYFLTGIAVILAVALVAVIVSILRSSNTPVTQENAPIVEIAAQEPASSVWGENFPNQYGSLLKTEANNRQTMFGGSDPYSKLEQDPRLTEIFAGYGFSKEYNEDRGHMNSLTDVQATGRVNEQTTGTCYSCKSSNNAGLWSEMGMAAYDQTSFSQLGEKVSEPIGCANCHEANTMKLIVSNPALQEALVAQGLDWQTFTRQEMRSVVCANCHVEYYFEGDGKYLTFPWENGRTIEDISGYYAEHAIKDWDHQITQAPMIKIQHPEFELFTAASTHYRAGVACADCHMPYTRDQAAKFSSHDVHSPLLNKEAACGQCHSDTQYALERAVTSQMQVRQTMDTTEDALLAAIYGIAAAASAPEADQALLDEARMLHREAQLRWDFIAAENSMGFHNPGEALRILASAIDLARQAQLKAFEATP